MKMEIDIDEDEIVVKELRITLKMYEQRSKDLSKRLDMVKERKDNKEMVSALKRVLEYYGD